DRCIRPPRQDSTAYFTVGSAFVDPFLRVRIAIQDGAVGSPNAEVHIRVDRAAGKQVAEPLKIQPAEEHSTEISSDIEDRVCQRHRRPSAREPDGGIADDKFPGRPGLLKMRAAA